VVAVETWLLIRGGHGGASRVDKASSGPRRFRPRTPSGEHRWLVDVLARSGSTVLVFIDPYCGPCATLVPSIARWQQAAPRGLADVDEVVVISRGADAVNAELARSAGLGLVLLQDDFEVARHYGINGTPGAVRVDRLGRATAAPAIGSAAIAALVGDLGNLADEHRTAAPERDTPPWPEEFKPVATIGMHLGSTTPVPAADPDGGLTVVIALDHSADSRTVLSALAQRPKLREMRIVGVTRAQPMPMMPSTVDVNLAVDVDGTAARGLGLRGAPSVVVLDAAGAPLTAAAAGVAGVLATLTGLIAVNT